MGEYGQIFSRSFVQKVEEERMGDTGRKRFQLSLWVHRIMDEREEEISQNHGLH